MVFPKRRLKTTSTQCTRERKPTARGGGDTIHTDATTEVPAAAGVHIAAAAAKVLTTTATGIITAAAAADHAAADHAAAAAYTAAASRGALFSNIPLLDYIGPHILWQDTFLQSSFAALSDDDMASSREDIVALQTLAPAV